MLNIADKIGMSARTAVVSTAVLPDIELLSLAAAAAAALTTTPPDVVAEEVASADSEDRFVGTDVPSKAFPGVTFDAFVPVVGLSPRIHTRCYEELKSIGFNGEQT